MSASGPPAQYSTLATYNAGAFQGIKPPIPSTYASGQYIVPAYGAPGYAALQHGNGSVPYTGYFTIDSAYGQGASTCGTRYMTSSCQ